MWSNLLLLALLFALPHGAWAAIDCTDANATVENTGTPSDPDNYPSYTAPSVSNPITIVGTGHRNGAGARTMTPTIGGNTLTEITTVQYQDPAAGKLWYRLNVTAGSADISVDYNAVPLASAHGVVTCSGVDQTTPIRASNAAAGTGTTPTVTVTGCLAGDLLIAFVTRDGSGAFTLGADQDLIAQVASPSEMNAAMSRQAGGGDNVMSWSQSSDQWTIQAVCLAPASAADNNGEPLWFP